MKVPLKRESRDTATFGSIPAAFPVCFRFNNLQLAEGEQIIFNFQLSIFNCLVAASNPASFISKADFFAFTASFSAAAVAFFTPAFARVIASRSSGVAVTSRTASRYCAASYASTASASVSSSTVGGGYSRVEGDEYLPSADTA